ncbi:MAG: hypothetical protein Q7T55_13145 [Solirubrobacteraceae bacterium]|nr:hypothetical protein [Solirubrobacteraceae bacterium]
MLNEIVGLYLADKYNITTDRILFTETIAANDTTTFSMTNAANGAKLKSDLYNLDYFITKYSIWSQNGILDVTIKPDDESVNQLKTQALTQKTEASVIPLKHIRTDLTIKVTNNQAIDDDLFLALEIFKIPQDKVHDITITGQMLCTSLDYIDIQTLAIEKYLIYTNELLKALIITGGGTLPGDISDFVSDPPKPPGSGRLFGRQPSIPTKVCRRT